MTREEERLEQSRDRAAHWKRWGPYLSERAWGTVREDYSENGAAWDYLPHDHARSRAYRWNEDGLAGICDRHQRICFAIALWNERDPILKERLFGLTGNEGNHGEDVKEYYFYLDSTPTHSYMRYLYKYPQSAFPYQRLVEENRRRDRGQPEFELIDTGVFDGDRYFDVFVEYAKAAPDDILVRVTAVNRGPERARLRFLPTLWFANTWCWTPDAPRPVLAAASPPSAGPASHESSGVRESAGLRESSVGPGLQPGTRIATVEIQDPMYGRRWFSCEGEPELLFTENETNNERIFNCPSATPFVKDAIDRYVVHGERGAVNPAKRGTKVSAHYVLDLAPGETRTVRMRLADWNPAASERSPGTARAAFDATFDDTFEARRLEADEFYDTVIASDLTPDARQVTRQAFAGLLWSKQFYHYVVKDWLNGDPAQPSPPESRRQGRNNQWAHIYNADVISMPDKWEYPWYAAWDLAFHCVPLALVDSDFAKEQLVLLLREWYTHPSGQLPAYEWALGDVNPPVHAWAAWRVYKIEKKRRGTGDRAFLERVFHKLLLNFNWWVNRKDAEGMNIFQGGFLGLDNIGVFDRSAPLPTGGHLEQSDGTSWMAMYSLNMLAIAMELARTNPAYEDVASKFWEHFLHIAHAMNHRGGHDDVSLWDEEDGFFYDVLHMADGHHVPLKIRSMVGLVPLFAVETLEPELLARLPGFGRRLDWFIANRPDLTENVACMRTAGRGERRLLSIASADQLRQILRVMLDEKEFLSPYGIRAVSRIHRDNPYMLRIDGTAHEVRYEPAESSTALFGGNSNWRGPIWFPMNFLIIESLQKFHHYLGDSFTVECPAGSGRMLTLWEVAAELSRRLARIFLLDGDGRRAVFGSAEKFQRDPLWRDFVPFHEYFNGDTGAGIGASHQTGWTGLVAKLLLQSGEGELDQDERLLRMETTDALEPAMAGAGLPATRHSPLRHSPLATSD